MNKGALDLQCELYRLLLQPEAEGQTTIAFIERTLELITRITGARLGYIEFLQKNSEKWTASFQCSPDDVENIQRRISSSIIAEAMQTGRTVTTPHAFLDTRFSQMESVHTGQIESVICSPIKAPDISGVIYLQGDFESKLVSEETVMEAEMFTKSIVPLLKRVGYQVAGVSPESDLRNMYELDEVIGNSEAQSAALNEAMTVASLDVTVLLTGETGTGKSLLARAIHENSHRCDEPFIHLNCANIPEQLFESELFGAKKGAYSGAARNVTGKIEAAEGGTLFLDEIGEISPDAQTKMLQFLEEGIYYPLGGNQPMQSNVRVIAASNVDFQKYIEEKRFREDLFYRISTFPIKMPPLRERLEDIPELLTFNLQKHCQRFKLPAVEPASATIEAMSCYEWPGNIRELDSKIQQGIIRAKQHKSNQLLPQHIFPEKATQAKASNGNHDSEPSTYHDSRDHWEKSFILSSLREHSWNVSKTAQELNLSRSHLNSMIKAHGLKRE